MPRLITPPATEPITLAEAKEHLRVDGTEEDTYLTALIVAARQYVEDRTGRVLVTQTWQQVLQDWPCEIKLLNPPLQSVTSITYLDADGVSQTLAADQYQIDTYAIPGSVKPAYGESWPALRCGEYNSVTIEYVAGYEGEIPQTIKQAIMLVLAHFYEIREPVIVGNGLTVTEVPMAAKALMDMHRVYQ